MQKVVNINDLSPQTSLLPHCKILFRNRQACTLNIHTPLCQPLLVLIVGRDGLPRSAIKHWSLIKLTSSTLDLLGFEDHVKEATQKPYHSECSTYESAHGCNKLVPLLPFLRNKYRHGGEIVREKGLRYLILLILIKSKYGCKV